MLCERPPTWEHAYDRHHLAMERYVIGARLKPGKEVEAERELAAGPPFDPAAVGLVGHAAYLSGRDVYLLFEGEAAHQTALRLTRKHLLEVSRWQGIVADLPSTVAEIPADARCLYYWRAADST
jgi:hypothetical protein